jgi:MFS family permease
VPSTSRPRIKLNRNLKLLFAVQSVSAVGNGLIMPLLSPYFLHLGLTGGDVGVLNGVMGLSMALALLPSAYIADARGRRPLALASFALGVPATLLVAAGRRELLVVAFVLLGLTNAAGNVSLGPLFADSVEREEQMDYVYAYTSVLALVSSSVGAALTWPLVGFAPAGEDAVSAYRLGFVVSAALFALCIPLLLGVRERRIGGHGGLSLRVSPTALKLAGLGAITAFGAGVGVWNVGYWFARKHGAEAPQLGAMSIASNILMAAFTAAAPVASARLGTVTAVVALQVASIPLLVAMALSSSLVWAGALYVVRSALMNAVNPLVASLQMRLVKPEERARMTMLSSLAWQVAGSAGAVLGGYLLDVNVDLPIYVTAVVYLVQSALFYAVLRGAR